ncbi:MAG: UDP-N-acetylenolpyruvoylglucosamine reductase [Candidatus Pelagibacter sp.]|nr:UDP-N-acetylenolpyruvoylglucosamine reductase [Candidatus Pelagibacter sp.]OUW24239.1 MAG: UDP-N-acetylenolpyruvoylglucosamine reductase [Rickettsiales bacterium TMED174]
MMNKIKKKVMLSKFNWFNLGGPAELFCKPENKSEIIDLVKFAKTKNYKINILGAGSNTLIRDNGVRGLTIKLGSEFRKLDLIKKDTLEVGSSTLDRKVANFGLENSVSGFEFLSCIPGSIGGAVIMNSGCYGEDISKIFVSLKGINLDGDEVELKKSDIEFYYRKTDLPSDIIITSVTLQGMSSKKAIIQKKQSEFVKMKKDSQPSGVKTCGSTFKNPIGEKAWELIKRSKCENLSVGDAKISEKHSNFFINNGKASAKEIESLISSVQEKVFRETGINLELEIKIVGD